MAGTARTRLPKPIHRLRDMTPCLRISELAKLGDMLCTQGNPGCRPGDRPQAHISMYVYVQVAVQRFSGIDKGLLHPASSIESNIRNVNFRFTYP